MLTQVLIEWLNSSVGISALILSSCSRVLGGRIIVSVSIMVVEGRWRGLVEVQGITGRLYRLLFEYDRRGAVFLGKRLAGRLVWDGSEGEVGQGWFGWLIFKSRYD